tara:strand:+ start:476 stop:712 length:237 start_codon:yes stop_codon:yes gene_type:complete
MQNQEIIKIIDNLKGRRNYEEKKATKLGFSTLYAYLEDKILRQKKATEDKEKELEEAKCNNQIDAKEDDDKKKSCSCC